MKTNVTIAAYQNQLIENRWISPPAIAVYFASLKLLIHFLANSQYGYFRDELYFLACGEHLDWGYVDHAPLIGAAARLSRALMGDSLFAIRFLPAVAGALKVLLTGLLAREFGGKRFAVALACLCVIIAPSYLASDNLFSMNAFEQVLWVACAYSVVLVIKRDDGRFLLLLGLLAGLGLQNKHSMLFFGFGIVMGLLLTPARRFFTSRWLWAAGAIAFIIFLPNLIWQQQHGWPTIELLSNVRATSKNVSLSPLEFIGQQFFILLPLTAPVWLAGLWFFFFDTEGKRYRVLGIAYIVVLVLMILLKGKNYYLLPAYPMLFAGGAVWCEKLIQSRRSLSWLRVAYPLLLIVGGALAAPLAMPVLRVETLLRYQQALGIELPKTEVAHEGVLPQHFGDMFGWPEMVETVAQVYRRLPPDERAKAAIFASNYGEAGAIDFFGPRYGLPKAISTHQNYYLWGPRDYTGEVMIVLQWDRESAERRCDSVEEAATIDYPYAMAEERYTVFICRGLKEPLREAWPRWKHWN